MRYRIFLVPLLLALFLLFGSTTPRTEAAAGIITTVAGGGVGDGGPATSGVFYSPVSVAVDGSGNLYVADSNNCRIRERVAIGGTITTVAGNGFCGFGGDGGPATSASLNGPIGAVVDSSGNLYIADPGNCRVRKVVLGTGVITTVAGNGTCAYVSDGGPATSTGLNYPSGVALDSTGANLYIADMFDCRVRKVVISTGIITTVAGSGTLNCFGTLGDGGLATSASLSWPAAVAVDGAGNFYIATLVDCRIRKVTVGTGLITTVAGNGTCNDPIGLGDGGLATSASLYDPSAVAVNSAGTDLYIADSGNCRIRKVIVASNITTVAGSGAFGDGCGAYSGDSGAATSARLNGPSGVALDAVAGNFYIADTNNCRIRKVTSGTITTVAGNGTCGYSGDGGAATSASLSAPSGVAAGNGIFYVTDTNNCRVRKVSAGVITTVAGNGTCGYGGDGGAATSASLSSPDGVALDASGNLYIADNSNCRVRKVTVAGTITTVAGNGVCDYLGDGAAATSASLDSPDGVAITAGGILYIADYGNCVVRKVILSSGIISTFAGSAVGSPPVVTCDFSGDGGAATSATLSFPSGVAVDPSGNLYIADYGNCRIRKVSVVDGKITTVAGNGTCGFSGDGGAATSAMLYDPSGVAVSGGNLYIADSTNCRVRKVLLVAPATITTVAGNGTCGYSGDGGPATAASLSNPSALGVDWGGNLYIADTGNDRVRKVSSSVLVGGVSVAPDVAALRAVRRTTQGPPRLLVTLIALTVLALFGAAGVAAGRKRLQ
ncbi:MAG: NHL repeat-containing protein [Chloroflexota bacterium]|nr:NHL repeat-containing protein [Chloroflexota bacterium]